MKYTIKNLMHLSGSSDNDVLAASEFCKEALAEAQKRADGIELICNLGQILDAAALSDARSALAGIRHLTEALRPVVPHHENGNLGEAFKRLLARLESIEEKAGQNYSWLCNLYPAAANS